MKKAAPLGNTFCGPGLFAKLRGDELHWGKKSLKLTAGCSGTISGKPPGWLELPPLFPLGTFATGAASTCSWVNSECIGNAFRVICMGQFKTAGISQREKRVIVGMGALIR